MARLSCSTEKKTVLAVEKKESKRESGDRPLWILVDSKMTRKQGEDHDYIYFSISNNQCNSFIHEY